MRREVIINAAVEGPTDEAVVRRLIEHAGGVAGFVYGKKGKPEIKKNISGYNNAARHQPWIVVVDLDQDGGCAPEIIGEWLPAPARHLCFRFAIRAIESWLLADSATLARFLSVPQVKIPHDPDSLTDPKQILVNLARRSRKKSIRDDMVPREGSGRLVGPAYASRAIEFAKNHWRPAEATRHSDSLRRTIACLTKLVNGG